MKDMKLSTLDKILMWLEDIARYIYRISWKLLHLKLYRDPEQYVPKNTIYCYEYTGNIVTKNHMASFGKLIESNPYQMPETKPCVFHNFLWHMDICMLDGGDCMMDSCKTCGISEGWEDEIPNDVSMRAIQEADTGIGTTTVHSIDDLMKAMED